MKIFFKIIISLSFFIFCLSCDDKQIGGKDVPNKNSVSLVPVNQLVDFLYPVSGTTVGLKDSLSLKYTLSNDLGQLDSVSIKMDGVILSTITNLLDLSDKVLIDFKAVGRKSLEFIFYQGKEKQSVSRIVDVVASVEPQMLSFEVLNEYPHDANAYTQGLEFVGDELYESTGQYGVGDFRKVKLISGKAEKVIPVSGEYFAEGLTFFKNKFYQLTWQKETCLIYDENMKLLASRKLPFKSEGWGLTHNDTCLIMSNGSSRIYFLDAEILLPVKALDIYDNKGDIGYLNELEIIEGRLFANVYQTNKILIIDLETGEVLGVMNMAGLLDSRYVQENHTDVLNGIAYHEKAKKLYVTGKNWPFVYQIKVPILK